MQDLFDLLKKEGCDVDTALEICGGIDTLYLKLLGKFVEKDNIYLLEHASMENDSREMFFQSHTLKGIYMNLGFSSLKKLVEPIVEATRNSNENDYDSYLVTRWIKELKQQHMKLVDIINDSTAI